MKVKQSRSIMFAPALAAAAVSATTVAYYNLISPVSLHHHEHPADIEITDPRSGTISRKSLVDYVLEECPSLSSAFHSTPFLFNGHLQTIFAALNSRGSKTINLKYDREILNMPDGGQVSLDWSHPDSAEDSTPLLMVLHGVSGGSGESYVMELVSKLIKPPYNYRTVVFNYRGCARTELLTPQLYNAGWTGDLELVVAHVQKLYPKAPLMAIGYSLGANLLVKYLGELGDKAPFVAGISVANPFDLFTSSRNLNHSFMGKHFYSPVMSSNLVRNVKRFKNILGQHTGGLDVELILKARSLHEFDSLCTSKAFGYSTADEYYRLNSSVLFLPKVRVPLLCLNAQDDPVAPEIAYAECKSNPYVILATTKLGGHIGWYTGIANPKRWCTDPLAEFCQAMFQTSKHMTTQS
ncbi:uncharacterized protein VTP21DRAFT_6299 [Calcarisporiella thermophila]|uniref:uncharacterized protein n=1 Tax=Calcarisporiella thermophila TaxID=911321 RepID=UPI0037440AFE